MSKTSTAFENLYHRGLNCLEDELEAIPEEHLWEKYPGVINSCGVLIQHITGNLNHYLGAVLGNTGYVRDRDREFTDTGLSKDMLRQQVAELKETVAAVISSIDGDSFSAPYPSSFPFDATIREALVHLYGHLNYHLGQVNYLRRIIHEKG